jgi:exosortase K
VSLVKIAAIAVALALVIAGKTYYRNASADDLVWLLAPTATCVSAATDTHFVRERGVGWIDRDVEFEIAPECAGLHFLLAALLVLVFAGLPAMTSWTAAARQLAIACVSAYAAAILVNTLRIAIAIRMHERAVGGADLHRLEGTVVYLGGLCFLYSIARRFHAAPAA